VKALGIRSHGGPDRVVLLDLPEPAAGPGEVRVRVKAAGFNHLDRFVVEGIPGVPIALPHALGSDGAGVVDAVGPDVTDLSTGARVLLNPAMWDGTCPACLAEQESLCRNFRILGEHTQGTAAEWVVVPRRSVYPIPERMSFAQAAAAPLVFQTAWRALLTTGALKAGETVAILGAGGGVATAAIQIAKVVGARVVVVSRSAAKAERARQIGADDVLQLSESVPLDRQLWEWSGKRGIDLVFDSVGAPTIAHSVRALARGGRVVVIGATAGPKVEVDLRVLFWRQGSIRGSTMANRSEFEAVLAHLREGRLQPILDREYPWSEATAAYRRLLEPDLFGKVVVHVGE
jgi:NADPH:quinone reductase-like Zn-dependent oxidoreductase